MPVRPFLLQTFLVSSKSFRQLFITQCKHLDSQDSRIHRTIDGNGGYGNARRHLNDRVKCVYTIENGTFYGYSDNGKRSVGRNYTGKGGSHSGSSDNHFDATVAGILGKLFHSLRRAVSRKGVHFERYMHIIQQLRSLLHYGKIGRTAHDDTYNWSHFLMISFLAINIFR